MFITNIFFVFMMHCACTPSENSNHKNLPVIIWWTKMLFPHPNEIAEIKCSLGRCLSSRKRKLKDRNKQTYIFYGTDFKGDDLPLPRGSRDLWALVHEESPMNNYLFSHGSGIRLFNYTSTFSRHSDFPITTQHIQSIGYLVDRKAVSLAEKNRLRHEGGLAFVMYLQSHCDVASDRDHYVKMLMEHIAVDSYGTCLHNKDLPVYISSPDTYNDERLMSFIGQYKFHLAFENALCPDYVTEKLYRALHVGSVPIYRGSPTAVDLVPSHRSVIFTDDFESPADLAKYINKVDNNNSLYSEFLEFKENGVSNEYLKKLLEDRKWAVNDPEKMDFIQAFECFICDKLHSVNVSTVSIASKSHMNCPQPHESHFDAKRSHKDGWMQEEWPETFWYAYDEGKAIELMIQNGENSSLSFMNYVDKMKYRH